VDVLFESGSEREVDDWWWTKCNSRSSQIPVVRPNGYVDTTGQNVNVPGGVRPAFWFSLSPDITGESDEHRINVEKALLFADIQLKEINAFGAYDYLDRERREYERERQEAIREQQNSERERQKLEAMQVAERTLSSLLSETAQSKYEFKCLDADLKNNRVLFITKDIATKMPYHQPGGAITWNDCTLRRWLNGDFYNQLPESIKPLIADIKVVSADNSEYQLNSSNITTDKVLLLSNYEAAKYLKDSDDRALGDWWWLRSPGAYSGYAASVHGVGSDSDCGSEVERADGGVRPAFWIKLDV
jgi:hypothetical protein